jgi:hypothetical protein
MRGMMFKGRAVQFKCTVTVIPRHHFAMIEPPRETMPVTRLAVRWM